MSRSVRQRLTSLTAVGVILAGCYTLQPVRGTSPEVGNRIAFDVNDAGRVALGGMVGPEIAQIEGKVVEKDSEGYLLSVTTLRLLRGLEQPWNGEQVRVKSEFLGTAYERRFSLGRSIGLGVVGIGGFTAFLATRSLLGGGSEDNPKPCDTCGQTRLGRP